MYLGTKIVICAIIGLIIGAIAGGIVGANSGGTGLAIVGIVGGGIGGAITLALLSLIPGEVWELIYGLVACAECCSMLGVFMLASLVTISSFIVWHSLLFSLLSGVAVMTISIMLLAISIYIQKLKYEQHLSIQASLAVS